MENREIRHMRPRIDNGDDVIAHSHTISINERGNGRTTGTSIGPSHVHKMESFGVLAAGNPPHTHEMMPGGDTVNTQGTKRY